LDLEVGLRPRGQLDGVSLAIPAAVRLHGEPVRPWREIAIEPDIGRDLRDRCAIFVDEPDDIVNPLGIKGLGEIGIVGVAAAIANAIYHATGKRVRDLPITLDKFVR
jgi:hypothetical protein